MLLAPLKRNILQKFAKLSLIVLLVPGDIGGSLADVCKYGMNDIK
jgi:hypothetical protein